MTLRLISLKHDERKEPPSEKPPIKPPTRRKKPPIKEPPDPPNPDRRRRDDQAPIGDPPSKRGPKRVLCRVVATSFWPRQNIFTLLTATHRTAKKRKYLDNFSIGVTSPCLKRDFSQKHAPALACSIFGTHYHEKLPRLGRIMVHYVQRAFPMLPVC